MRKSAAEAEGGDENEQHHQLGGRQKGMRELIYQRMPKEFGRYIEVFGGGGWVLFGRAPDTAMEVYNDFNSDLANLFRCVRDRPLALKRVSAWIDMEKISKIINETPTLIPIQKEFYTVMISERKAKIIDYSMDQLMKLDRQKPEQEELQSHGQQFHM